MTETEKWATQGQSPKGTSLLGRACLPEQDSQIQKSCDARAMNLDQAFLSCFMSLGFFFIDKSYATPKAESWGILIKYFTKPTILAGPKRYFTGFVPISIENLNFIFTPPGTTENGSYYLSQGEVNRKSRGRAIGELFRLNTKVKRISPTDG